MLLLGAPLGLVLYPIAAPRAPQVVASSAHDVAPPCLPDGEAFARGMIGEKSGWCWWRQTPFTFQLVVMMPEDASFKRDVQLDLHKASISLTVAGSSIVDGPLAHNIRVDASDWYVEDELEGFDDGWRYLVVDMAKADPHVDWQAPLQGSGDSGEELKLVIGGVGEAQKKATAQQMATYQALRKLPACSLADVYARPASPAPESAMHCYFVGKIAGDDFVDGATSLAAQEVLVKQHARLLLPDIFGGCEADSEIELWLAPGDTEVRVAQNELSLSPWRGLPEGAAMPKAVECGFDPETREAGQPPFFA